MPETEPRRRRRGSEQRRRSNRITFRARTLNVHHTAARRRPPVEVETIARLHAEMNRVRSNIHQILKRVNFGETPLAHEFHDALDGYREVIDAILVTLGRKKAA
jgi:hypothetical protein